MQCRGLERSTLAWACKNWQAVILAALVVGCRCTTDHVMLHASHQIVPLGTVPHSMCLLCLLAATLLHATTDVLVCSRRHCSNKIKTKLQFSASQQG